MSRLGTWLVLLTACLAVGLVVGGCGGDDDDDGGGGAATQLGLLPARGGPGETALLLLRGFGLRRRSA